MCIYDHVLNDVAKNSADQKLINDIKDAVAFLNEEKFKLSETSMKIFSTESFLYSKGYKYWAIFLRF